MPPMLRLTIPAVGPTPVFCDRELVGGCYAFTLESIFQRMAGRRDHLAKFHLPVDPASLAAAASGSREQSRLQTYSNNHWEYHWLVEAIPVVESPLARGEDLEVTARMVLFPNASSRIEKHAQQAILAGAYEWMECRACERRYSPAECVASDWSRVADARAGIGGRCLACPAGHVVFSMRTWVA